MGFNFSLISHHRLYVGEDSDRNQNYHRKVLRFYKHTWKMLQLDIWKRPRYHICRDIVTLSVLNNMGVVFHNLGNYQKAWHCFMTLKKSISFDRCKKAVPRDVLNGVMMNASLLQGQLENIKCALLLIC